MSVFLELAAGSLMIILCAVIHLGIAALIVKRLKENPPLAEITSFRTFFLRTSGLFLMFLVSHTLQIYLWAFCFWLIGALPGHEAPIYFALVTYSTVGYGDLTLVKHFRIFGAMASVSGIFMFGVTTAFLVGFFARTLDSKKTDHER